MEEKNSFYLINDEEIKSITETYFAELNSFKIQKDRYQEILERTNIENTKNYIPMLLSAILENLTQRIITLKNIKEIEEFYLSFVRSQKISYLISLVCEYLDIKVKTNSFHHSLINLLEKFDLYKISTTDISIEQISDNKIFSYLDFFNIKYTLENINNNNKIVNAKDFAIYVKELYFCVNSLFIIDY